MDYAFCEKKNVPEAVIEGTKQRAPCVFPFNYEGKQITHCTDEGVMMNRYLWCATKKNKEGGYEQWGKCIPDAKLASNEAVIRPCALPFKWNGVVYTDCKLNLLYNWCPLIPKGAIAYPLNARNDMSKDEWGKCVKPYEWLRQRGSAVGQRLTKGTAIRNRKLRAAKKEQLLSERTEKHSDLDIAQMQHTEGQTLAVKQLIAASKGQDSEIDRQDATENFSGSYDIDYL